MKSQKSREKIAFSWIQVGHERVASFLQRSIQNNSTAHAYLLQGLPGTGKGMLSELFVRSLLCTEYERPCGLCNNCIARANNAHPDIVTVIRTPEMQSIGVEQIRELNRVLRQLPVLGLFRIGIIRDAELLTNTAANALLKLFEEAPASSILIAIANSVSKLPKTLLSRCQQIKFAPLPVVSVQRALQVSSADESKAHKAASIAFGRAHMAQALYDDNFQEHDQRVANIISFLENKPFESFLTVQNWLSDFPKTSADKGSERREMLMQQIEYMQLILRDLLMVYLQTSVIVCTDEIKRLLRLAQHYSIARVIKLIEQTVIMREQLLSNVSPQIVFENFAINASV